MKRNYTELHRLTSELRGRLILLERQKKDSNKNIINKEILCSMPNKL